MLEPSDKAVFLECECHAPEHIIRVTVFDWDDVAPDFIIEIQAHNWKNFFKRCWSALKYIFGTELVWDDVYLTEKSVIRLQDAINHYNNLLDKDKKLV